MNIHKSLAGALLMLAAVTLTAQSPAKVIQLKLISGEKILQCAATRDQAAYATMEILDDGTKKYTVIINDKQAGVYDEIRGLQAAFDTSMFIYAARTGSDWTVFEGSHSYGPYSRVENIRSGADNYRCLYLATAKDKVGLACYHSGLRYYYFDTAYQDSVRSYTLSENGKAILIVAGSALNSEILYYGYKGAQLQKLYTGGSYFHTALSSDGRDIAALYRYSDMDIIFKQKPRTQWGTGIFRFEYPGSFGSLTLNDTMPDYNQFGDFAIYYNNAQYHSEYYYSVRSADGTWRLFRNGNDQHLWEKSIKAICPLPDYNFAYAGKPVIAGNNNMDTSAYYAWMKGSPVGGPYLDVQAIIAPPAGNSISVIARTPDGWYIIIPGGGIGPFEKIADARYYDNGGIEFRAIYGGDWMTLLITGNGLSQGSVIRDSGKPVGLAYTDGQSLYIYILE